MALLSDGMKVLVLRKSLDLKQSQLAEKLGVSTGLVSAIEKNRKKLSVRLRSRLVEKLGVNGDWLDDSTGSCFASQAPNAEKLNAAADRVREELAQSPIAPLVTVATAIGISTTDILQRLCKAYSASNLNDLAINHLHVSPSTISGWIKRNKISEETLHQVINEGKITPEQLLSNDEYVLAKKLDLVDIFREMYLGETASRPQTTSEIKAQLERLLSKRQNPIRRDGGE